MNILITGSAGFVGRNLVENLKNLKDGKNRNRPNIKIENIFEYDVSSTFEQLNDFCSKTDFVFNLAGVNRPTDPSDFQKGNFGFATLLLDTLKKHGNKATVLLSSSIQACLLGRYENSEYGKSKKAGEELFFQYSKDTGAKVLVYRFPNLAGKWTKPNYNSVVATICHNVANDLPITINDPNTDLDLLFIDDLLEEMFDALEGKEHHCEYDGVKATFIQNGRYCAVPITHTVKLGYIAECVYRFAEQPRNLILPEIPQGSFEKKLYSMYVSYLPKNKISYDLKMNCDDRGSFTELLKTINHGQFSVNICKPGATKGQHWHNSKWELFFVVSGHGLIQERKIGSGEILEFEVCGEKIQAVHMLPGYTHKIVNLSDTENLVTLMWANEINDSTHPDTFFEQV